MRIGDKVRVKESYELFAGCEGTIIEVCDEDSWYPGSFLVELYKGNGRITEREIQEYLVYFKEEDLEIVVKLNVKKLREEKNTDIISTEKSLRDVEAWFNKQMEEK